MQAAAGTRIDTLVRLVDVAPGEVWLKEPDGTTPLHAAAANVTIPMAAAVLVTAVPVDSIAKRRRLVNAKHAVSGRTPLHAAAAAGNKDAVVTLAVAGADTNVKDREGNTPLDLALAAGYVKCAKALRQHAATPTAVLWIDLEAARGITALEAQKHAILAMCKLTGGAKPLVDDCERLQDLLDDCAKAAGVPPATFDTRYNISQYTAHGTPKPAHALNAIVKIKK